MGETGLVSPDVVTVTFTLPALPPGEMTVRLVLDETVTALPGVEPKSTFVEPGTKLVPETVTLVPPATGPDEGFTAVTVGGEPGTAVSAIDGPHADAAGRLAASPL